MTERKTDQNKERSDIKTFPVPFPLGENQGNLTISTKSFSKPSKEQRPEFKLNINRDRKNKRIFCTYGDIRFKKSRERIIKEAETSQLFDKCFYYSDTCLLNSDFERQKSNHLFNKVSSALRGGGYWIWKPYILLNTLKLLEYGDTLIYCDAGSTIVDNQKYIKKLDSLIIEIENSKLGVLGCRNTFIEKDWTKGDIFQYFDSYNDVSVTHSRQFSAGRLHIAKKCNHSLNIYSTWWETAIKRPDLFDDSSSETPNFSGFKENRHDASVWSLICKKFGVVEKYDWDSIPVLPTRIRC